MAKASIYLRHFNDGETPNEKTFEGEVSVGITVMKGDLETNQPVIDLIKADKIPISIEISWKEFFEIWRRVSLMALEEIGNKRMSEFVQGIKSCSYCGSKTEKEES